MRPGCASEYDEYDARVTRWAARSCVSACAYLAVLGALGVECGLRGLEGLLHRGLSRACRICRSIKQERELGEMDGVPRPAAAH